MLIVTYTQFLHFQTTNVCFLPAEGGRGGGLSNAENVCLKKIHESFPSNEFFHFFPTQLNLTHSFALFCIYEMLTGG